MEANIELSEAEVHLARAEADLELAQDAERRAEQEIKDAIHEIHEAERHKPDPNFVEVEIATTSGFFPDGYPEKVSIHERVEVQLAKAANALKLTNTTGWIATAGTREINPQLSFEANGLHEKVVVDWGPKHGGGGA
jgi:hypothetical protein